MCPNPHSMFLMEPEVEPSVLTVVQTVAILLTYL